MKVLYITAHLPYPPNNGARIRDFNILKRLANRCEISLLSFYENPEQLPMKVELEKYCRDVNLIYRKSDKSKFLRYFNAATNLFHPVRPFHAVNYCSEDFKNLLVSILSGRKFDIIQIGFLHMAQYVNVITNGTPVLLDTHNVEHVLMDRYAKMEKNAFIKMYILHQTQKLRKYEIKMYPRFNLCIMESQEGIEAMRAISYKPNNFRIICSGVDTDYFAPPSRPMETNNDLIFTGTLSGKMNINAVIFFYQDILPLIRKQIPNVKLMLVGTNPDKGIIDLGRRDPYIKVIGNVPDIRPYMLRSKVVIVPLQIGAGIRLKIREAMAMGIPVISTSIGCEGTKVTHGKDIIIADTPENFARETIRLLTDKKLREKLYHNGRKLVSSIYDWDKIVQILYSTYTEVVENHRRRTK
jgi:sugar transferase (PEP-CTERM/EpsH1 system associated)